MSVKDFKTSGYFSWPILFLGVMMLFLAVYFALSNWVVSIVLCLPAFVILTTHYRLRIDLDNKTYHDYLWILGMRQGDKGRYGNIDYLFLKAKRVTQNMQLKAASSSVAKDVVDAYLKFDGENKIHLFTRDSRHDVVVRLKEIAAMLNTRVIDYTSGEGEEITS